MKTWLQILCLIGYLLSACDGGNTPGAGEERALPPREATDPVPEPPSHPDTGRSSSVPSTKSPIQEPYYTLTGTEPFWSLTLGSPYSTFRSMEGDSLSFPYQAPEQAAGRPEDWTQLFPLGNAGWVLLRKGRTPCSDGMSDREYAYTATVWLQGRLLDGCARKE